MSDDIIDGNVGTEYEPQYIGDISPDAPFEQDKREDWTFEKLEKLRENNELLQGISDTASDGTPLEKVVHYTGITENFSFYSFEHFEPITGTISYKTSKNYYRSGSVLEFHHIIGDFDNHKGHFFVPFDKGLDKAKELVNKLLNSDFYKTLEGEEDES